MHPECVQPSQTQGGAHPPRPRLALNIGVTGHRRLEAEDSSRIRLQVGRVLSGIQKQFSDPDAAMAPPQLMSVVGEPCVLRVLSSLAEGADRIVAEEALGLGYQLHGVLPFGRAPYEQDFAEERSRRHFRELLARAERVFELDYDQQGDEPDFRKASAYEDAGRCILMHCDVLLAIWNGARKQGPGGTAQMVAEADALGVPVLWLESTAPYRVRVRLRDAQGNPQLCGIQELRGPDFETAGQEGNGTPPEDVRSLQQVLRLLLDRPGTEAPEGGLDLRVAYFSERVAAGSWLIELFSRPWPWLYGRLGRNHDSQSAGVVHYRPECEAGAGSPARVGSACAPRIAACRHVFAAHRGAADFLAVKYANLYRSSFLVNYVLAGAAVTLALASTLSGEHHAWRAAYGFSAAELGVLLLMGLSYSLAKRGGWQEKLTDYRLVAEQLRHQELLAPLGLALPAAGAAAYHAEAPREHWAAWYLRSVLRECGLSNADLNAAEYRAAVQRSLRDEWIAEQCAYHEANARRTATAERRLHRLALALFTAVVLASVVHLTHLAQAGEEHGGSNWLPIVLALVTVAGPAWAAATHAFIQQAELRRLHLRSAAMQRRLKGLRWQLEQNLRGHELRRVAANAADAMSDEAFDWRIQYRIPDTAIG